MGFSRLKDIYWTVCISVLDVYIPSNLFIYVFWIVGRMKPIPWVLTTLWITILANLVLSAPSQVCYVDTDCRYVKVMICSQKIGDK